MAKYTATERAEATAELRKLLPPGSTVYTVLRHVSASGMSRRIDLYLIANNKPRYLTGYAARAMGYRQHKHGGLVVSGCGMDMGFHLVNSLSYALHGMDDSGKYRAGYTLAHEWL